MTKYFISILLLFFIGKNADAAYDLNDNLRQAWVLLIDFDFSMAKQIIANEIKDKPDNYYAYYLDQTCDAYELLLDSDDDAYEEFLDKYYERRDIMDDKDADSPYYLSCLAEMELQAGIFNIIHGDRLSGLRKAYSAYKDTYRNLEKHPEFKPSLKLDGFFNVAVDNLPPFVKFAVSAFGVSGDADHGFDLLLKNFDAQKNQKGINAESALFVVLSAKLNKTPGKVYDFTHQLDKSIADLFAHQYFRANIEFRTGNNEQALNTLREINIEQKPGAELIYNYLMGKVLLNKLDFNAGYYLKRYLSASKKKEYVKEINYKLAIFYLINNNKDKFNELKEVVLNDGNDINERDREALYDANLDYTPDLCLTKAHLLIDGGYYDEYQSEIQVYKAINNDFLPYKLEYYLIEGKAAELKNNYQLAVKNYKNLIDKGSDEDYYFACEAALRCGILFEKSGKAETAKKYFEKSLKLYDGDYYEYLESRAKKGLKRLE
ncbi:MAG: hypothetical protein GXO88_12245 [Chlorobi bacterium]|nr:hypothetical protein [Chlorobiota bacterium]